MCTNAISVFYCFLFSPSSLTSSSLFFYVYALIRARITVRLGEKIFLKTAFFLLFICLQFLSGNINTYTTVKQKLELPFVASRIRFVPHSEYVRTVCMRVEIYGCPWPRKYLSIRRIFMKEPGVEEEKKCINA